MQRLAVKKHLRHEAVGGAGDLKVDVRRAQYAVYRIRPRQQRCEPVAAVIVRVLHPIAEECGSLNSRLSLLATGRFVTVMPDSFLNFGTGHLQIRVLPIVLPKWTIATSIITLKNRTLSPAASLFIDCARDLARQVLRTTGNTPS